MINRRNLITLTTVSVLPGCMAIGPDGTADFTHLNIPVIKNVSYGENPAQRLDIYPAQQNRTNSLPKRPAVVFFHGGFWQFGQHNEASVQTICSHLAARGITAISASYRLYPETDYNKILEDASMAVAWAYKNAGKYGAEPEKVVASGWSAGGWMASMMLVRPEFSQKLLGIEKNGKHPLVGMIGISAPYGHWPTRYPLLFSIFKDIPTKQRLPNTFIRPGLPPSLLIQGMLDIIVWPQNAILFGKELIAAGNSSKVVMRPLQDHMTTTPLSGILPGSLKTVDDMENFVKNL